MLEVIPLNLIHKYKNSQIKEYRHRIVASAVLMKDSKVLLLKRGPDNYPASNTWSLPAGGVEHLETPEKAVLRELKEEINVNIEVNELIKIENYFYDKDEVRTYLIEFIYHVSPLKKDFKIELDQGHTEYKFVLMEELNQYTSLVEPRKQAIREIYKKI